MYDSLKIPEAFTGAEPITELFIDQMSWVWILGTPEDVAKALNEAYSLGNRFLEAGVPGAPKTFFSAKIVVDRVIYVGRSIPLRDYWQRIEDQLAAQAAAMGAQQAMRPGVRPASQVCKPNGDAKPGELKQDGVIAFPAKATKPAEVKFTDLKAKEPTDEPEKA